MESKTYKIDATNRILGRLAAEIVVLLRGKNRADFAPNKETKDVVMVENVSKMKFSGKKAEKKIYYHHSGYPGGLKEIPLSRLLREDPVKILRMAVFGMLPKNRLRSRIIKRLKMSK